MEEEIFISTWEDQLWWEQQPIVGSFCCPACGSSLMEAEKRSGHMCDPQMLDLADMERAAATQTFIKRIEALC